MIERNLAATIAAKRTEQEDEEEEEEDSFSFRTTSLDLCLGIIIMRGRRSKS